MCEKEHSIRFLVYQTNDETNNNHLHKWTAVFIVLQNMTICSYILFILHSAKQFTYSTSDDSQ